MNRYKEESKGSPIIKSQVSKSPVKSLVTSVKSDKSPGKLVIKKHVEPEVEQPVFFTINADECEMLVDYDSCTDKVLQIEKSKRRSQVKTLHNEVTEIKEMFDMINEMVDEQGESINTIENNVISAKTRIEKAEGELDITENRKSIGTKIKYGGVGLLCFVVSVPIGIYAGAGVAAYSLCAGLGFGGYALLKK